MVCHAKRTTPPAAVQYRIVTAGMYSIDWRPFPYVDYDAVLNIALTRGPGFRISDYESNRIIGQKQYDGARAIMEGSRSAVSGAVRSVHVYLNMCVLLGFASCANTANSPSLTGRTTLLHCPMARKCRRALQRWVRPVGDCA